MMSPSDEFAELTELLDDLLEEITGSEDELLLN
jgi:hypothetical protein